ncbi:hypothetical protein ACIA71_01580 [Streptomyces anulatus]
MGDFVDDDAGAEALLPEPDECGGGAAVGVGVADAERLGEVKWFRADIEGCCRTKFRQVFVDLYGDVAARPGGAGGDAELAGEVIRG